MSLRFHPIKLPPSPIKPHDHRPLFFKYLQSTSRTVGHVVKSYLIDYQDPSHESPTDESVEEEQ